MKRRTFLAGVAASAVTTKISAPAFAQSSQARVLKFVPNAPLVSLDPSNTANATTNAHGYCVFDTLYGVDTKLQARPQMVEGHTISSDKLTWDLKLRPQLKFHDGERVLAKDCVASIKRWWQRDAFGVTLSSYTDELSAADDNTIRFRLKKPFAVLPDALGHVQASPLHIMPERIANPDPAKQITEMIGSGPLKFVASEFVPGQRAAYERNTDYVPRQEQPEGTSGGKVIHFDRVEWRAITDVSTAAAALQANEIDWWEAVQFDLVDVLKSSRGITVTTQDPGYTLFLRFNCGIPPFNNAALRRVVAAAISQKDITQAITTSPELQSECFAIYNCLLPGVEQVGKSIMGGPKDYKALAAQAKSAGYNGEKLVLLRIADIPMIAPIPDIVADALRRIGMNVEVQSMDLATALTRRQSQAPLSAGGWSMFASNTGTSVTANPVVDVVARGLGAKGYPGNYEDPELESRIASWIDAPTQQDRFAATTKIQERLFEMMPMVPLGGLSQQTAFRSNLTGYLPNTLPVMWNIRRT